VATIGPSCSTVEKLANLIVAGVDVFRINMAHGSREEHEAGMAKIREAAEKVNLPVGILIDLAGPKIRLGKIQNDKIEVQVGDELTFVRGNEVQEPNQLVSNYKPLLNEISAGAQILIGDGTVILEVVESSLDSARCRVVDNGTIRSKQGINLPGVHLSAPAMGTVDRANAEWAAQNDVDFISLSFVRTASEILELKELLKQHATDAAVIAKIEKREALENLEPIVQAADGVMVARGDLGVEIDIAATPIAQKRIIDVCQHFRRPVIVATQMLESMHESKRPTRAEVTDVANAILDGADACMLSGETAIGDYPVEAVQMMNSICLETEELLRDKPSLKSKVLSHGIHPVREATVFGAAQIAKELSARMVVIATTTGGTARIKSKQRDFVPTLCITDSRSTYRKLSLCWGIVPVFADSIDDQANNERIVFEWIHQHTEIKPGDCIVYVLDLPTTSGARSSVLVAEVR